MVSEIVSRLTNGHKMQIFRIELRMPVSRYEHPFSTVTMLFETKCFTGLSGDKVIGRHPTELFPFLTDSGVIKRLESILQGEASETISFPFEVPNTGMKGWASDTSTAMTNEEGDIIGVIGMVSDITELKKAEESFQRIQVLDVLSVFNLGKLYHYVNKSKDSATKALKMYNFLKAIRDSCN